MPGFLCNHCGHENNEVALYCRNCGALQEPESARTLDAAAQTAEAEQEEIEQEEAERPPEDVPQTATGSNTETEPPAQDRPVAAQAPAQPLLLDALAGLIPEREVSYFGSTWAPALLSAEPLAPSVLEEMKSRFGMSTPPVSVHRTDKPPAEAIHRQFILYAVMLLAALLPFWLGSLSLPAVPYNWDGTEAAWQTIQDLEAGSQVLIYWQNDPGVAGELDLPLMPVLTHLLAVPAELHLVTQHPLGLAQARGLLDTVRRRQAVALSEVEPSATVHEIGFWPGGYAVLPGLLPWLATHEPDLQIVVSADSNDVIHWLEQVAPHVKAPVLAVTSAGIDQMIRPYQDSAQLVGVVRGYNGAQAYAQRNAARFPNLQARETELHMAAQNWVSAALILAFLTALLLRHYVTPPWTQTDLDS